MAFAIAISLVATPGTAEASSVGCTAFGNYRVKSISLNYLCIDVNGKGLHIDRVQVGVTAVGGGVQNVVLKIRFYDATGKEIEKHVSGLREGIRGTGVDHNRKGDAETFTIHPKKKYPNGKVCGSFTENGQYRKSACVGILR